MNTQSWNEIVVPRLALALLVGILSYAVLQSGIAIFNGTELKQAIPVLEAPIAAFGKSVGAFATTWMGNSSMQKTVAYIIYEWVKLPIILYLTTFGMSLLRLSVNTRLLELTLGRNDLGGVLSGTALGIITPVCSCTVTNLYAGLVAGGASMRASAAFLFASPALNEFAIIFIFLAAGPVGCLLYVACGLLAAIATGYMAGWFGLDPARFVRGAMESLITKMEHPSLLVRAHVETLRLCKRLLIPVLIAGLLAGILINFNLTLVESLKQIGYGWWGPVVAMLIGLPLDINAASTAPMLLVLSPIVPLGTLISAMMATTVSSIPEVAMLKVLVGKNATIKLVAWYAGYVMAIGLLINALFATT